MIIAQAINDEMMLQLLHFNQFQQLQNQVYVNHQFHPRNTGAERKNNIYVLLQSKQSPPHVFIPTASQSHESDVSNYHES